MNDILTHAFKGMDPEDHKVRRILMVGAHPDEESGRSLSLVDNLLLRSVIRHLESFKIPLGEGVLANKVFDHDPHPSVIRPICILEEYGGENFLVSQEKGDIVVLCNVPRDDLYAETGFPELRKSFQAADNHADMGAWNAQILNTGAKMAFIFGVDSFDPDDFNKKDFIKLKMAGPLTGILIRRSFFEEAASFLLEKDSPLAPIITHFDNPDITFEMDTPKPYGGTARAHRPNP